MTKIGIMQHVERIEVIGKYKIWVRFSDGEEKVVNVRPLIGEGFTKELLESENFNEVYIEEGGGLAWPNGFDICPNYLKSMTDERQKA